MGIGVFHRRPGETGCPPKLTFCCRGLVENVTKTRRYTPPGRQASGNFPFQAWGELPSFPGDKEEKKRDSPPGGKFRANLTLIIAQISPSSKFSTLKFSTFPHCFFMPFTNIRLGCHDRCYWIGLCFGCCARFVSGAAAVASFGSTGGGRLPRSSAPWMLASPLKRA